MRPTRILLVEDDVVASTQLGRLIGQMGYQTIGPIARGEEAVAAAALCHPDVVLMDIQLSGEMNGLEAADQIGRQFDIPVVFLTACADDRTLDRAKSTQSYGFLIKPVRPEALQASLEMAVFRGQTDRRFKHLNAVLRSIRSVDQLLTRARDPRGLLVEACRILVQTRGYLMVWVAGPSAATGAVEPIAAAGLVGHYLDPVNLVPSDDPTHAEPSVAAWHARQTVVHDRILETGAGPAWSQAARALGYASCAALLVRRNERQRAVLGVYADQPEAFNAEELSLLEEMANDLAFGLQSIEEEEARRKAEHDLRQAHDLLERRVEERTAELSRANSELRAEVEARARAEAALSERQAQLEAFLVKERQLSDLKTRFISTASHEFRTPMTVAAGFADMLRNQYDQLSEEKRRALLDRILESIWRVTRMLDSVLTANRLDQARIRFNPSRLNLAALAREITLEIRMTDKGTHEFAFESTGHCTDVVSDEDLFRPILTNLLTNAVRYSPQGTRIDVRLSTVDEQILLEVQDRGIGIPAQDQARIFEPFERGQNVGTVRGFGIGLDVVRRLSALHGGTVDFVSSVNEGSTFRVRLPRESPLPPSPGSHGPVDG
jgi:signal transduction histidine kinase/CheY-like chemotaxis protein